VLFRSINNIDKRVIVPAIERLYHDNLRYSDDPDLVGDLQIVARGASSLVVKEAEAIRRNEFLQIVLNSPVAQQIVGADGTAELLRQAAKNLDTNVDEIVPTKQNMSVMQQQQQMIQQLQEQMAMMQQQAQPQPQGGQPAGMTQPRAPQNVQPDGSPAGGRDGNMMRNVATGRNG
jgi:hypothetical protein